MILYFMRVFNKISLLCFHFHFHFHFRFSFQLFSFAAAFKLFNFESDLYTIETNEKENANDEDDSVTFEDDTKVWTRVMAILEIYWI